jgi:hypothetical protein
MSDSTGTLSVSEEIRPGDRFTSSVSDLYYQVVGRTPEGDFVSLIILNDSVGDDDGAFIGLYIKSEESYRNLRYLGRCINHLNCSPDSPMKKPSVMADEMNTGPGSNV